jgi:hypothetical protein
VKALGLLALACYAAHAGHHLSQRRPENLLWMCSLASVVIGLGLVLSRPDLNAIGVLWLVVGLPLWLGDVATGGEFLPTSLLTHIGGLAIGIAGLTRMGLPHQVWWKALAAAFVLHLLCRRLTSPAENVNLAFAPWRGWEGLFRSHAVYVAAVAAVMALSFFTAEILLRRLLGRS